MALSEEENTEFERIFQSLYFVEKIMDSDILPACIESRQIEGSKREDIHSNEQKKIGRKQREVPLIVVGVNECMRNLQNDNLRLVVVNKVGK